MRNRWPELPRLDEWADTFETLQRWTQIVGKVRLAATPWTNHSWHVPFYVTSRGLTTSVMYQEGRAFQIDFDFVDHRLVIATPDGRDHSVPLAPMSVADFYAKVERSLREIGVGLRIWTMPVEIPGPIEPFPEDTTHASYEREPVERFFLALLQAQRVLSEFRARFIGKVSPVHFFWGGFDLAVTRFSGRTAPKHPGGAPNCANWVMEEAYSHEVSSAGLWPGKGFGETAFYSYAYPEPPGFRERAVKPEAASYHPALGELLLPYDAVRRASSPDEALLSFLQSAYESAADLAAWDRAALERALPPRATESAPR